MIFHVHLLLCHNRKSTIWCIQYTKAYFKQHIDLIKRQFKNELWWWNNYVIIFARNKAGSRWLSGSGWLRLMAMPMAVLRVQPPMRMAATPDDAQITWLAMECQRLAKSTKAWIMRDLLIFARNKAKRATAGFSYRNYFQLLLVTLIFATHGLSVAINTLKHSGLVFAN